MYRPTPRRRLIALASIICLLLASIVIGILWCASHSPDALTWTFLLLILVLVASLIALAWSYYLDLSKSMLDSGDKEERSAAKLDSVMESSGELNIFSVDRNFRYLHFNSRHRKDMLQYFEAKPAVGEKIPPVIPEDVAKDLRRSFFEAYRGENMTTTRRLRDRFFKIIFTPIVGPDNKVFGLTCNLNDITEKVQIEQQLEEYRENLESKVEERTKELIAQRDFFQKVIDATSNLIFVRDEEGNYVLVNQAAAESFPEGSDAIIGKSILSTHRNENQARTFMLEDKRS